MTETLDYLNARYGQRILPRFDKLDEEYNELTEAMTRYKDEPTVERLDDVIDELADVNILIYHIAGLLSLTQDDLVRIAADKIKGREKAPNYKRKHKHDERTKELPDRERR